MEEWTQGRSAMNDASFAVNNGMAQNAVSELKGRIRRIHLEESLAELSCGRFRDKVPVAAAFQRIQDKAMERMVPLLDTKILCNAEAIQSCLEMVAEESERVAWSAL